MKTILFIIAAGLVNIGLNPETKEKISSFTKRLRQNKTLIYKQPLLQLNLHIKGDTMTLFEQMLEEQILMAKEKYEAQLNAKKDPQHDLKDVVKTFSSPSNKNSVTVILADTQAKKAS